MWVLFRYSRSELADLGLRINILLIIYEYFSEVIYMINLRLKQPEFQKPKHSFKKHNTSIQKKKAFATNIDLNSIR